MTIKGVIPVKEFLIQSRYGELKVATADLAAYARESFVPGVLLAVRKVRGLRGLLVGLENVL